MADRKPALSLAAVPTRRVRTLELAKQIEARGFAGIYCPSMNDGLALCEALAFVTNEIRFGTSIAPIYTRHVNDFAQTCAFIHEVSGGRFDFGVGVSHAPAMSRLGVQTGKPLSDMRTFVLDLRAAAERGRMGDLPRIVLATLRKRMIKLAEEVGNGMVFANGARSHMADSLAVVSAEARESQEFFIGNMIPTCIDDDESAAKERNRKTLASYAMLPNYNNYWKEAGYVEEMEAVAKAASEGRAQDVPKYLSDAWLADTTLFGSASKVRDGIEAWFDAGIKTPIIVPSSTSGGQMQAFEEFFSIW